MRFSLTKSPRVAIYFPAVVVAVAAFFQRRFIASEIALRPLREMRDFRRRGRRVGATSAGDSAPANRVGVTATSAFRGRPTRRGVDPFASRVNAGQISGNSITNAR